MDIKSINNTDGTETSTTGGVLMPRVNLVSANSLEPFIAGGGTSAQKTQHRGMQVYHLGNVAMESGMYVWTGASWIRFLTSIPAITSNQLTLDGPYITETYQGLASVTYTNPMSFGAPVAGGGLRSIVIEEDGSYTFVIRLYGRSLLKKGPMGVQSFYFFAWQNGLNLLDACEFPITTSAYSYSSITQNYSHFAGFVVQLTMTDLRRNDVVTFTSLISGSYYPNISGNTTPVAIPASIDEFWTWEGDGDNNSVSAVRASLVYWKL